MIDWTASMQQTFEFYTVDPNTWGDVKRLDKIKSCSIIRNDEDETLGSATIESTEVLPECYVREYLVCIQNGEKYTFPLGTHLVQTPEEKYDGRVKSITMDAYTPLIELKDNAPPYGYTVLKNAEILSTASDIVLDNTRSPVTRAKTTDTLESDFVSDFENDSWLKYVTDLLALAEYKLDLDEMGRILFKKKPNLAALTPVWTYDDGNSSILYPSVSVKRDLYGVPNVVEVLYSTDTGFKFSRIENNDESSIVSIPRRGREVIHRVSNPNDLAEPNQTQIDTYAKNLLMTLSTLEYEISYTHGYCPVRVGDAVWINYERAGLKDIRAVVKSQSISCIPGCPVTETAIFTTKLWG